MKRIDIGPLHLAWEWGKKSDQFGIPVIVPDIAALFGWPDWAARDHEGAKIPTTRNITTINVPIEQPNSFGIISFRRTSYAAPGGGTVFDSGIT